MGNGVYMENCKHARMGFHGSLEVVSKGAFGTFLTNLEACHAELPVEDGVGRVPSRQEVIKVPIAEKIFGLHLTVSCPDHSCKEAKDRRSKKWMPNCTRVKAAGMHPFKKPDVYMRCVKETMENW